MAGPSFLEAVRVRSTLYAGLREVLHREGFHEVATPVLSPYPDIAPIPQFQTAHPDLGKISCLRIAPTEFLKRVLEGGAARVYEFSTNFRSETVDPTHLPEFTSLEAMQREADVGDMQCLTERLVASAIKAVQPAGDEITYQPPGADRSYTFEPPWARLSIPQLLAERCGFARDDFFDLGRVRELHEAMAGAGKAASLADAMDEVVTAIARSVTTPVFVGDFPHYLGGPARPCQDDPRFKERSELFVGPLELANMSSTLTDAAELRAWHEQNLALKAALGIHPNTLDRPLLEAAERGIPPSAVVGLGVDRLLMILCGADDISSVRLFSYGTLHVRELA